MSKSALWPIVAVALVGGVAVAVQSQLISLLERRAGTVGAVLITYGTGGALIAVIAVASGTFASGRLTGAPWYAYLAGVVGLIIIGAIGISVGRLGVVTGLTVMLAAQFVVTALIDQFGWMGAPVRPIGVAKAAGLVLVLTGSWLTLR